MKKLSVIAATLLIALSPIMADTHITVLGTSDLHGNIWGFSYEDSKETDNNGMARLYTYIEEVREGNPSTVLIDAGDDIQGTIMSPYGQKATKDALAVVKEKGVKKFIATLIAQQVIQRTAEDIVKYLFLYLSYFDESDLGDYLGSDGGTTDEERTLMTQIRYRFVSEDK